MSLLPTNHDEFRTKKYWDDFFVKRGDAAFEWYGNYREMASLLNKYVLKTNKILNIGCGNSAFSSDFYDQGFRNITNLDFSEIVIEEMKAKNVSREQMTWDTGDMTDMKLYNDNHFDVVFDKGGLDALMSVDTPEVQAKAQSMFNEISRVLVSGGKYISVTLAEKFIIRKYMSYFSAGGWSVSFHPVHSAKPSPFLPFFVVAQRTNTPTTAFSTLPLTRFFVDHVGNDKPTAELEAAPAILDKIQQIQDYHRMKFQIAKLQVGRFEPVHLWSAESQEVPRFTIFVMDVSQHATLSCAVFMVPFGRESEFQFSTQEGLIDIAYKANCKRFLAVCCNRPHTFPPMQELQAELSPIAMSLRLQDMDISKEQIPFMTIDAESDWETINAGSSALSGPYIVEESPDDAINGAILRRLIFLQNQNFIQTEVRLLAKKNAGGGSSSNNKKKKSGAKGSAAAGAASSVGGRVYDFDYTSLDAHHRAALAALTLHPQLIGSCSSSSGSGASSSASTTGSTALVVGLGGGALPMCLQKYLPGLTLWACDLDPQMEVLAREFFGFKSNARTNVLTHEGMSLIQRIQNNSATSAGSVTDGDSLKGLENVSALDLLFIDADSKDPSQGISAPPAAFITLDSLTSMYAVLKPGGVLLMNVVARAKDLFSALLDRIASVFQVGNTLSGGQPSRLYTVRGSTETINIAVIVVKGKPASSASTAAAAAAFAAKSANKATKSLTPERMEQLEREKTLEKWLKDVGDSSDVLKLEELLGEIKPVSIRV